MLIREVVCATTIISHQIQGKFILQNELSDFIGNNL